jgi:adenine deaminase
VLVPGFIDTHLHVESSLVTPHEFDRCVTPRGVTTAICDPHEIANVCGIKGIRYFLESASAAGDGPAGAAVVLRALDPYGDDRGAAGCGGPGAAWTIPKVIGLAEFMNYPGVLMKDPGCMEKLEAFQGRHIDGHAPLAAGRMT